MLQRKVLAGILVLLMAVPWVATAAPPHDPDFGNLEEDMPTRIEDAFVIPHGARELRWVNAFIRTDDNDNVWQTVPKVALGLFPNAQFEVAAPFYIGEYRRNSGDVQLSLMYNVIREEGFLPAASVKGQVDIPTGKQSKGFDTTLKVLVTKTISETHKDRIHFNWSWKHNFEDRSGERVDGGLLALGYSRQVTTNMLVIADMSRQKRSDDQEWNLAELGMRWQVAPRMVLSIGGAYGLGADSPNAIVKTGLQYSF